MSEAPRATPTALIYGSCVSRDIARLLPDRLRSDGYIARQSWISAFSAPTTPPDVPSALKSPFQHRMVESDLQSTAPALIREGAAAARPDMVLLDIVDERYGVIPTETGFITNSFELIESKWKKELTRGELIPMGTDEHFTRWVGAAERLIGLLQDEGLLARAFLLRVHYATHTDQGEYLGERRGRPVEEWDAVFAPYYDWLEQSQLTVIEPPQELAVTRHDHEWGKEPFHYIDAYYEAMADLLDQRVAVGSRRP